jgi:uncharacterized alpha-E superfamily protein
MLSKVAERVYWVARYIERVENIARLSLVHSNLLYDMPKSLHFSWASLVDILGAKLPAQTDHSDQTERAIIEYLLIHEANPNSLVASIRNARENARTTRDVLPKDAWRQINELHLLVKNNAAQVHHRGQRQNLMKEVISRCQAMTGIFAGSMSQNNAFYFLVLGRNLERADMTTRLLDVGGLMISGESKALNLEPYLNILWANLLRSASAYLMYRQQVGSQICSDLVTGFLLQDTAFPRSVAHCVKTLHERIQCLPNSQQALDSLAGIKRLLAEPVKAQVGSPEFHCYLDDLQCALAEINQSFYHTWFAPRAFAPAS